MKYLISDLKIYADELQASEGRAARAQNECEKQKQTIQGLKNLKDTAETKANKAIEEKNAAVSFLHFEKENWC